MKTGLILILMALCMTSTSNALIADKFRCSLEIKDFKSKNLSKQDKEIFIARLPTQSSDPQIQFTIGQVFERLSLKTPTAELSANLNFYFKHAIKTHSSGLTEARQLTCVALTTDYCERGPGPGIVACSASSAMCMEPPYPFDLNLGWQKTLISAAGPVFNEQELLAPITVDVKNDQGAIVGVANLNCKHKGTFN